MIIEYHRPESMTEALALLARKEPRTVPLGGGTVLSRQQTQKVAVVDLQYLGLNTIRREGQMLHIGAAVTLQTLLDYPELPEEIALALHESIQHEAGLNIRQMATVAGLLVSCNGRSPFITGLLALDPRIVWIPADETQPMGDYLPLRDAVEAVEGRTMISELRVPVNTTLRFAMVARSPQDQPLVCAAMATWPSGRTRVTLGGYGKAPVLAMDGPEPGGAVTAAREAYRFAGDAWASAAYRMEVAGKLAQRLRKGEE